MLENDIRCSDKGTFISIRNRHKGFFKILSVDNSAFNQAFKGLHPCSHIKTEISGVALSIEMLPNDQIAVLALYDKSQK